MRRLRGAMYGLIAFVGAGLALFAAPDLFGAELHLSPAIMVEQEYTDNYYRTERDKVGMFVTQIAPGFGFQALTDRSRIDLSYVFSYYWYESVNGRIDASRYNYAGQNLNLFASTRLYTRLKFDLLENYILTREPAFLDTFSQIVTNSEYWRNRVEPSIAYDISEKGEVRLGFRNEVLNYLEKVRPPGEEDSVEERGILTLTYNLNATNHLDLQTQIWQRSYSGNANSSYTSYQSMVVFRRELSTYFDGQIGAGYQYREFSQSELGNDGLPTFLLRLNGTTEASKGSLSMERNLNDFTQDDNYFSAFLVRATGEHLFLGKIRAYVGGYYQFGNYLDSSRHDGTWNGLCGIGYLFLDKRFEVSVEYNYTNRDSNQPGSNYAENQIYFRLSAHHDFAK